MYFILPVWLAAGWLCHRAFHDRRKRTTDPSSYVCGSRHPLLEETFLEVNALIIALMIVKFFVHEATAMGDVSYAT
jgi:hypothetical protein